jgi:hypothetical protein
VAGRPVQSADDRVAGRDGKALAPIVSVSEKALAAMRWQPVQSQAEASRGGALTRMRVCPHRRPPSQGSFHSLIASLLRFNRPWK